MTDGLCIGIDLGTTNSVIAAPFGESPEVIENASGGRKTPSVAAFAGDDAIVGREAVNQAAQNPEYTVHSIKRQMGERDFAVELPDGRRYTPEEVSALILKKLKVDAERALDAPVTNAVITVPAYFGNGQREATKYAGEIAGLTVDRILNEPTAACLAYGLGSEEDCTVLVYDLGGGTFDVSLVDISGGIIEVRATDGDTDIGGEDWDARILELLLDDIEAETGRVPDDDPQVLQRLWDAAEAAKHDLTTRRSAAVTLPFLMEANGESYTLETSVSRDEFERESADLLEETLYLCDDLLEAGDCRIGEIDEILLVGGSTRMPQVAEGVEEYFGREPSKRIDTDMAVALGAAAQAGIMSRSALPNPGDDELVAYDESAYADDVLLLDVTPKTLGIASRIAGRDNQLSRLIPRNSSIPTRVENEYWTVHDNQEAVTVEVYQGENQVASENVLLDEFTLIGIPPAPAGEQSIHVTFELDENGILNVSAENRDGGVAESITVESEFATTERELEGMQRNLPDVR